MRKCEKCEQSTDKPIRVVTERKMVTHADGNSGSQIVKETNVCANCLSSTPEAFKPERVVIEKTPYTPTSTLTANAYDTDRFTAEDPHGVLQ